MLATVYKGMLSTLCRMGIVLFLIGASTVHADCEPGTKKVALYCTGISSGNYSMSYENWEESPPDVGGWIVNYGHHVGSLIGYYHSTVSNVGFMKGQMAITRYGEIENAGVISGGFPIVAYGASRSLPDGSKYKLLPGDIQIYNYLVGNNDLVNEGEIHANSASYFGTRHPGWPYAGTENDYPYLSAAGIWSATHDTVWNTGTITAEGEDSAGIVGTDYASVFNTIDGQIDVRGRGAYGIAMFAPKLGAAVQNAGKINIVGDDTTAIYMEGMGIIQHDGIIGVTGDSAWGIAAEGEQSRHIEISSAGDINMGGVDSTAIHLSGLGKVDNSGSIYTLGADSSAIFATGEEIDVINADKGYIDVRGSQSSGVYAYLENGSISNAGVISTSAVATAAVLSDGAADGVINITNTGKITMTSDVSVGVLLLGGNHTVYNDGEILAEGDQSTGIALGLSEIPLGVSLPGSALKPTRGDVVNSNTGSIRTLGQDADAIHVRGGNNSVTNFGFIETLGKNSSGIELLGDRSSVSTFASTIKTMGEGSSAISVTGNNVRIHNGVDRNYTGTVIETKGDWSPAIHIDGDASLVRNVGASILASGDFSSAVLVSGDNATLSFRGGNIEVKGDESPAISVRGEGAELVTGGAIDTTGTGSHGLFVEGSNSGLISNLGRISTGGSSASGIHVNGSNLKVLNIGTVFTNGDSSSGVHASGSKLDVSNAGIIQTSGPGSDGLFLAGDNLSAVNSGKIEVAGVASTGVFMNSPEEGIAVLENSGAITALLSGTVAVQGGDGSETVNNSGCISGRVNMGGGDDLYAFSGPSFEHDGEAYGGNGRDWLVVRNHSSGVLDGYITGFESFVVEGIGADVNLDGTLVTETARIEGLDSEEVVDNVLVSQLTVFGVLDAEYGIDIEGRLTAVDGILISPEIDIGLNAEPIITLVEDGGYILGPEDCVTASCLELFDSRVLADTVTVYEGGSLVGTGEIDLGMIDNMGGHVYVDGGRMAPGHSPGRLRINGNLAFLDGYLNIDIWGSSAGEYDVLDITGDVSFNGGVLDIFFGDAYLPMEGDIIDFLVADSISGLDNLILDFSMLPQDYIYDVQLTASGLSFYVLEGSQAVPEPQTFYLMVAGMLTFLPVFWGRKGDGFQNFI